MPTVKLSLGWNRVRPEHELMASQDGFIQCSKLQNYICRYGKIKKVGGTGAYNSTALINPIPWVKRTYHLRGDGSFKKYTFCYSDGKIYSGDDVTGTLTERVVSLIKNATPTDMTYQVSGNSILYMFTGGDAPQKFDGNGSYTWEASTLSADITMGVVHLDRAWYIRQNTSVLQYSVATTNPETLEDEFIVGNDKDSYNVAIVLGADEAFYIFKNNAIYQLYGRTAGAFQVRLVTNKYGLANKRAICATGSGFVFLNTFDNELYFFGGNEMSIRPLTEADIRLRDIINTTPQAIDNVCMTVHDGLFRFAFQHRESAGDYNNCELVYPLNEPGVNSNPKWSLIKGSNVLSYSVWNQQGDNAELVTGRSDTGKLMYHNRGWDFDGGAIETIARTGEVVLSNDSVTKLGDLYIKAKPGSANVNALFRYYMNARSSERGEESQSMRGETRQVGQIYFQMQAIFNDNIKPLERYARGSSVSFEIYDYNNGTEMELYSITFGAKKLYPIRNQLV